MTEEPTVAEAPRARRRPGWAPLGVGAAALLAAAALAVAVTRTPAAAAPAGCSGSTPRLTVQGTGQASGSPDSLAFQAEVDVTASSAQGALSQDDLTTQSVVQAIEGAGVPAKDVQTTDLTINPDYSYSHGQSVITGYSVSNNISVTVTALGKAGSVLDAATTAGGNALSVDSLNFARTDPRTLEDRARVDAVRQAVSHAGAMARAAGQRLGPVCSLTDQSGLTTSPEPLNYGPLASAAKASVPLEGGTEQANAQVTLVYSLTPLGR